MNFRKISGFLLLFFLWLSTAQSQSNFVEMASMSPSYSDCAAIFYKGQMLVDQYSPEGKCKIEQGMKGPLTLSAVKLGESMAIPTKTLSFQVAIRNTRTNTLWMYMADPVKEIQLEDILKECERGDRIILLPTNNRYALPHHEIELVWGC